MSSFGNAQLWADMYEQFSQAFQCRFVQRIIPSNNLIVIFIFACDCAHHVYGISIANHESIAIPVEVHTIKSWTLSRQDSFKKNFIKIHCFKFTGKKVCAKLTTQKIAWKRMTFRQSDLFLSLFITFVKFMFLLHNLCFLSSNPCNRLITNKSTITLDHLLLKGSWISFSKFLFRIFCRKQKNSSTSMKLLSRSFTIHI